MHKPDALTPPDNAALWVNDYPIFTGNISTQLAAFLQLQSYSQLFILADTQTFLLCLPVLQKHSVELTDKAKVICVPNGEINKNISTCQQIWAQLLAEKADRNALLLNLGGGVVGDMGGFCASVYKRGISFIQVPTTLLAQVDASVGSKTGIDFGGVKNSIGTFTNPIAVFIDPVFLQTLPQNQISNGFAEMLKHGLIADAEVFAQLSAFNVEKPEVDKWKEAILRSVQLKKSIVEADPLEKGLRKILNFGHTIGHALESFSLQHHAEPLLHGEAIALGMLAELFLSGKKVNLSPVEANKAMEAVVKICPVFSFSETDYPEILQYIANDKKNTSAAVNCTLITEIGKAVYDCPITKTDIVESLQFLATLAK